MRFLKRCYLALVMLFLYLPIGVLILYSFNASKSRSVWSGRLFAAVVPGPLLQRADPNIPLQYPGGGPLCIGYRRHSGHRRGHGHLLHPQPVVQVHDYERHLYAHPQPGDRDGRVAPAPLCVGEPNWGGDHRRHRHPHAGAEPGVPHPGYCPRHLLHPLRHP